MTTTSPYQSRSRLEARPGPAEIVKAYSALSARNLSLRASNATELKAKSEIALEMGALWARDIRGNSEVLNMPLMAATAADTLGTLAGTLVAQQTLDLFRIEYPLIQRCFLNFSSEPAHLGQIVNTRIVGKPSVQTYDPTLGADGRPLGWKLASAATTTSVDVTVDEHIGVPIMFDANALASTSRKLFEEMAPAAAYALASYFVAKIYALMIPANFNAYAVINGAKVPVAYTSYARAAIDFARSAFVDLAGIFSPNEVPNRDRSVVLNTPYYSAISKDPSLATIWSALQAPEIVTEGRLPKLSTFLPVDAPDFPTSLNRVGFAMQRAAIVAIARPPSDYNSVLPGAGNGLVLMVTDPDTQLTILSVQYVDHKGGYSESRLSAMIGAGVGDKRAGLCITSN